MDIGEEKRTGVAEPLEIPVPQKQPADVPDAPAEQPVETPAPVEEPVGV